MYLVLACLGTTGTFLLLRRLSAASTFGLICTTAILSPGVLVGALWLDQIATHGGAGFAAPFVLVTSCLAGAAGLIALAIRGLLGWIKLAFQPSRSDNTQGESVCKYCHHTLLRHRVDAHVVPNRITCTAPSCMCSHTLDAQA